VSLAGCARDARRWDWVEADASYEMREQWDFIDRFFVRSSLYVSSTIQIQPGFPGREFAPTSKFNLTRAGAKHLKADLQLAEVGYKLLLEDRPPLRLSPSRV
jgi:hypothetical protein